MEYLVPDKHFDYYFKLSTTATGKELNYEILKIHFLIDKINTKGLLTKEEALKLGINMVNKDEIIMILKQLEY